MSNVDSSSKADKPNKENTTKNKKASKKPKNVNKNRYVYIAWHKDIYLLMHAREMKIASQDNEVIDKYLMDNHELHLDEILDFQENTKTRYKASTVIDYIKRKILVFGGVIEASDPVDILMHLRGVYMSNVKFKTRAPERMIFPGEVVMSLETGQVIAMCGSLADSPRVYSGTAKEILETLSAHK